MPAFEFISPAKFNGVVTAKTLVADQTLAIDFELEGDFRFNPGQYLSVDLPLSERYPKRARRAYSIWTHPSEQGPLRFVARLVPGGRASDYLAALSVGDPVGILGPFGVFVLREPNADDVYFVATGTGLAPLRNMIVELLERPDNRSRIHLDLGFRYDNDVFGVDELLALTKSHDRFELSLSVSRPTEDWAGERGRLTAHWAKREFDPKHSQFYLCGSGPMINNMRELLLERGLPETALFTEKYYD